MLRETQFKGNTNKDGARIIVRDKFINFQLNTSRNINQSNT